MKLQSDSNISTINIILYTMKRMNAKGISELHELFKTIYFAEKIHLARYGRGILEDKYIKMEYGPVPSWGYDFLKQVRSSKGSEEIACLNYKTFQAKIDPDMDYISESEVECIDESISKFGKLGFRSRTDLSHDKAWSIASYNREMDIKEIAKASGMTEDMYEYFIENTLLN